MYQFHGAPGASYQQHPRTGAHSDGRHPPFQQIQACSPPQYPPMPMPQQNYQILQQTAQPPVLHYRPFPPAQHSQFLAPQGFGAYQQQSLARDGIHLGNGPFTSQPHRTPASYPERAVPHPAPHFEPQAMIPSNFPHPSQRQASQSQAMNVTNRMSESCYNCGAPDHWAQNCTEPRRAVPAGLSSRPSKRQKTHVGPTPQNYRGLQQPPPNLQCGWTHPLAAQQPSPMSSNNSLNLQATSSSTQRSWTSKQDQKSERSPALSNNIPQNSSSQQHPLPGSFTPRNTYPGHQKSRIQEQNRDSVDNNQAAFKHPPWSRQQQFLPCSSTSPATTSDLLSCKAKQHHLQQGELQDANIGDLSTMSLHHTQADCKPATQTTQWSAQNLPTPAPSSLDSQIPSPATSNMNSVDQNIQQTPRDTESPGQRQDSVISTQKNDQDAQKPLPKSELPDTLGLGNEGREEVYEELDGLYGLDFPNIAFEQKIMVQVPALLVAEPLPPIFDQPLPAKSLTVDALQPKYLRDVNEDDFLKNVQESARWDEYKNDPVFAKIKANTITITFDELIQRRCQLVRAFSEADADDEEEGHQPQETEEERLAREQEERLAALGVTGTAKPVKASPTDMPCVGTPSAGAILATRRVSGNPGWQHYHNDHTVTSPSASKDSRSFSTIQCQSPQDLTSDAADKHEKHSYRKRTYSEASNEMENMPRQRDLNAKPHRQRYKQPRVAPAYDRRW